MPALRVAPFEFEPMVLRLQGNPGTAFRSVRHDLEHVFNMWQVSGLQPSVAMDVVPEMCRLVVARGLVRGRHESRNVITVHSYNVRICHWINVVACGYLLWSGVHILLDFPELYWGNTGYRGYPAAFRLEDWGLSWDEAGALGDRRWGRNYHFTFAWVFLINGLVYVAWNLYSRHFRDRLLPAGEELSIVQVRTELRDHFRWRSRRHTSGGT